MGRLHKICLNDSYNTPPSTRTPLFIRPVTHRKMGSEEYRPIFETESSGDSTGAGAGDTLYGVLSRFVADIISPEASPPPPVIQRVRASFCKAAPRIRDASKNSARDLLVWTRSGSHLRALLVISVGSITLLALTGLLIFMLFFLVATINAIIVAFLISLAAAGGFFALFFACLTVVYIGALSAAIFVISATTISTIIGVVIATGWLGFFCVIWLAAKKSVNLTKKSLTMTSSAISAYSTARQARSEAPVKSVD